MSGWKILVMAAALAVATVAQSKGNFQAQGTISDVQKRGVDISFKFSGSMSLSYATAPQANPRRKWQSIALEVADLQIHISDWTQAHQPSDKASQPETERIYALLSQLVEAGSVVQLSVDNPSLSFSNAGELTRASGTFVYARPSDQ